MGAEWRRVRGRGTYNGESADPSGEVEGGACVRVGGGGNFGGAMGVCECTQKQKSA